MEDRKILPVMPQNMKSLLAERLGKRSISVSSFIRQATFKLLYNEFISENSINIRYDNAILTYEVKKNICRAAYLFFDDDTLTEECVKHCDSNYARVADNTWHIIFPDNPNIAYKLSLLSDRNENGQEEISFCCVMDTNKKYKSILYSVSSMV